MSTNQAETASAQSTLEKVRELSTLIANGENQKAWNTWHMWATPIASLVESQAKRIEELEKEHQMMRTFIRLEAANGNKEAEKHLDSVTLRPRALILTKMQWSSPPPSHE